MMTKFNFNAAAKGALSLLIIWLMTLHDIGALVRRTAHIAVVDRSITNRMNKLALHRHMFPERLSESISNCKAVVDSIQGLSPSAHITSQQLFLLWNSFVPQATVQPYEREPLVW